MWLQLRQPLPHQPVQDISTGIASLDSDRHPPLQCKTQAPPACLNPRLQVLRHALSSQANSIARPEPSPIRGEDPAVDTDDLSHPTPKTKPPHSTTRARLDVTSTTRCTSSSDGPGSTVTVRVPAPPP